MTFSVDAWEGSASVQIWNDVKKNWKDVKNLRIDAKNSRTGGNDSRIDLKTLRTDLKVRDDFDEGKGSLVPNKDKLFG